MVTRVWKDRLDKKLLDAGCAGKRNAALEAATTAELEADRAEKGQSLSKWIDSYENKPKETLLKRYDETLRRLVSRHNIKKSKRNTLAYYASVMVFERIYMGFISTA